MVTASRPSRFYGLPNIYNGVPLSLIVSVMNKLAKIFGSVTERLDKNAILVSFDVKSLFTNVPVEETLELCKDKFSFDIENLIEH